MTITHKQSPSLVDERPPIGPKHSVRTPARVQGYMPALDGLRAFAVAAVIAYHLDLTSSGGGYLGVDIFFVLSGFLITSLLLKERTDAGRIAFRAFWARRARRLLPALLLVLAALALYAGFGGPGLDRSSLRPDSLFTLFYSANWHQIFAQQSYFAQFSAPSPLKHTWSLAIEEQFYVLWPLILVVLLRMARGSRRLLVGAVVTLAAASATLMALLYHPGVDPSRIYYGTDTRAFELLIGALLAVLVARGREPSRGGRRVLHAAGIAAMGLIVYECTSAAGPPGWMWRGGLFGIGLATAVVIASASLTRSGPLGAVLSLPPLRWIGIISYGLYLWHWPVIVLMTHANTGLSGAGLRGAQVATMLTVATLSYLLVERPIRGARFRGWKTWVSAPAGVAATATALLFATVVPNTIATAAAPPVAASSASAAPAALQSGTSVMVVGDTKVSAMALGMKDSETAHGLSVHEDGGSGCSVVEGYTADNLYGPARPVPEPPGCRWRAIWPQQLRQWGPKVAYVGFGPYDTADHLMGGRWLRVGTPEWQSYYQDHLAQMTSMLESGGAHVVLATVPLYRHKPTAEQPHATFADPVRVDALNALYRSFTTAHPNVVLYDVAAQVAPGGLDADGAPARMQLDRLGGEVDTMLARIANPTIVLPPGRVPSPADPLRVMIVGDSLMLDASPGITAALQATGVVKVVSDISFSGWGLTSVSNWTTQLPEVISQHRPELVIGMWSWDGESARLNPPSYTRVFEQAMSLLLAPGTGVDGVALLQWPKFGPDPNDVDPAWQAKAFAVTEADREAWNSLSSGLLSQWPDHYLFLPVAGSLEVNGQYSSWLPGPAGTWTRVRKTDNRHFCPSGSAVLGQDVLDQLTPVLHLPRPVPGWWAGSWTKKSSFNVPPGACPDDHP